MAEILRLAKADAPPRPDPGAFVKTATAGEIMTTLGLIQSLDGGGVSMVAGGGGAGARGGLYPDRKGRGLSLGHRLYSLLGAGFTTVCYDGQFFYDTDHPVIGAGGATVTTVSNFQGGSGTPWFLFDGSREIKPMIFQERLAPEFTSVNRPNDESVFGEDIYTFGVRRRCAVGFGLWQLSHASRQTLTAANYAAARAAMMGLRADGGRPLGIRPNLLIVPPSLEEAALGIVNTEYGASGASNVWKGTAEVIVAPWLA